ncbi:MAG: sulfatase-like hydrolase/transferase [Vicinamibacterales bacterium]
MRPALQTLVALAGALGLTACQSAPAPAREAPPAAPLARANVLLVTIDTLRADRVGAYGHAGGLTPTIDRLAREGVRVADAHAHVPLTLPSHTALMTGAYPFVNGVRDNGSFRFDGSRPTLASALKAAGYRTGAFVSSFVLDARFGLSAGFDRYDSALGSRGSAGGAVQVERPADATLAAASAWIGGAEASSPWFAWVHLYDPHEPYAPPAAFRARATDPYDAEIAYADAALGNTLAALTASGRLAHTLVVVAADHGEALGDHGERTHGLFAYEATLRVPLVLWAPGAVPAQVLEGPARLVDVLPTVLDLTGVNAVPSDGRSLWPAVRDRRRLDDVDVYFEALNANLTRHWAPLTGLLAGPTKFVDLPIREFYDLAADPGERSNLYETRRADADAIARRLFALRAKGRPAAPAAVDADTERRLRSLGYVTQPAGSAERSYTSADDPKTLVPLHAMLEDALAAGTAGRHAEAERLLQRLVSTRPDFTVAYDRLAQLYHDTGRLPRAIALLETAATRGVADATTLAALGGYLQEAGQVPRAVEVLEAAGRLNPSEMEVFEKLGVAYTRAGRFDDAQRMFTQVLTVSPDSAATLNNQGSMYLAQGRWTDAIASLRRALAVDPSLANAHNGLGVAFAQQGDFAAAIVEWQEALRLRPDLADARDNIARARELMRRR